MIKTPQVAHFFIPLETPWDSAHCSWGVFVTKRGVQYVKLQYYRRVLVACSSDVRPEIGCPKGLPSRWSLSGIPIETCPTIVGGPETSPKRPRKPAETPPKVLYFYNYCPSIQYRGVSTGCESVRFDCKPRYKPTRGPEANVLFAAAFEIGGLKAISGIRRGGLGFGTDGLAAGGQPNASQGKRSTRTQQGHRKLPKSYWKGTRNLPETSQKDCHRTLR